ncbi:MAG TPA: hypothetical protein VLW85_18160 [Myxococcales bacterium]|nr:hypothetical protein [Myxococcales bacterium]
MKRGLFILLAAACGSAAPPADLAQPASDDLSEAVTISGGLLPVNFGREVYDFNNRVYWLADANLAADAKLREKLGFDKRINPDGTMDWKTARDWVDALNQDNYLGRSDWQLPTTPRLDETCTSQNGGDFGATCTHSALGNLYAVGLGRKYPDSIVGRFDNHVAPVRNLQPSVYWDSDSGDGGESTFSFDIDYAFENTTKYNDFTVPRSSRTRTRRASRCAGASISSTASKAPTRW